MQRSHRSSVERPVQLHTADILPQDRHPGAEARFKGSVLIDKDAVEARKPRLGQHRQRQIAQVAIVSLVKDETGGGGNHTLASLRRGQCGIEYGHHTMKGVSMSYVLVSYTVRDYARWRSVFDADTIVQRHAGVFVRHMLHDEKHETRITLVAQVKNRRDAIALSRRKELPKLIEQAGVLRETVKYKWLCEQ
jgi:hypothetical protein